MLPYVDPSTAVDSHELIETLISKDDADGVGMGGEENIPSAGPSSQRDPPDDDRSPHSVPETGQQRQGSGDSRTGGEQIEMVTISAAGSYRPPEPAVKSAKKRRKKTASSTKTTVSGSPDAQGSVNTVETSTATGVPPSGEENKPVGET